MPPAALEAAPQTFIASLRIRDDRQIAAFDSALVSAFPNVSVINVTRILENVQHVLGALTGALRVLSWLCVSVGLLVLAGTLSLGHKERREQAALFRALGCERRELARIDAVEFAAIGLLTFAISWVVSYGLAWAVSRKMNVELSAEPRSVLLTLGLAVVLPVVVGLAVNARAYGAGVLETFRREA
jgi:putative ABC transport system permease protein